MGDSGSADQQPEAEPQGRRPAARIRPLKAADWPGVWALLEPVFRAGESFPQDPAISEVEARRLGYRAMQFNLVVSTNTAGLRCWQANGFRIVGTLPGAFRHRRLGYVDAYVMFREL